MKRKILIFLALMLFFTVDFSLLAKSNNNKGKGSEKRSEKAEGKTNMGKSEDAKKNWGQLKEDSYATEEERTLARLEIQHKKQLRKLISAGDLEYTIDSDEEFIQFLEDWYAGLIEVPEELRIRFEEEFRKHEELMMKAENGDMDEEDMEVEEVEEGEE